MAQGCRRHLLIAGTGRAGTTFLVRFLNELGLDTHISRAGDGDCDEAAQAGLEDLPVSKLSSGIPYVLKQPWSYQLVDQLLDDPGIELEAVILPMRDLTDAAASRTVLEIRAIHEKAPWMAALNNTWDHWGHTPGGGVFSLDPLDQARLLALGFHRLLERLVKADIPVVLLSFPRLVHDPDYLYRKLRGVLPAETTAAQAAAAHKRVADRRKVRIDRELRSEAEQDRPTARGGMPSYEKLENIALRRELCRTRAVLADAEATVAAAESRFHRRSGRLIARGFGIFRGLIASARRNVGDDSAAEMPARFQR